MTQCQRVGAFELQKEMKLAKLTSWKFGCPIQIFNTNQVDFLQFYVEPARCLEHSAKSVVTVKWRTKWPSLAVATTAGSASQYPPWSLIKVFMLYCFSEQARSRSSVVTVGEAWIGRLWSSWPTPSLAPTNYPLEPTGQKSMSESKK